MEQSIFTIKSQQKRTDHARGACVTKSTNDAIGCADLLYLNHGCAFATGIGSVPLFRDNPVKIRSGFFKPLTGRLAISRRRRRAQIFGRFKIYARELFEEFSPLREAACLGTPRPSSASRSKAMNVAGWAVASF